MKKHAYLLMIVNNLEVIKYNLKIIDDINNDIFIHVDKKSSIYDEIKKFCRTIKNSKVFFVERIDVRWGDYSQIDCELNLIEYAISKYHYQYYHLISESDLLIKNSKYIYNKLDDCNLEFVDFRNIPNRKMFEARYKCYHLLKKHQKMKNQYLNFIFKVIRKTFLLPQILFGVDLTKKYDMEIKYGSNWFSITDSCARYVISKRNIIEKMFKNGSCVDEHFLQTIIWNSDFKKNIAQQGNMRLIMWDDGSSSPIVYRIKDYDILKESNCFYARKFNESVDIKIVDKIYQDLKESVK